MATPFKELVYLQIRSSGHRAKSLLWILSVHATFSPACFLTNFRDSVYIAKELKPSGDPERRSAGSPMFYSKSHDEEDDELPRLKRKKKRASSPWAAWSRWRISG